MVHTYTRAFQAKVVDNNDPEKRGRLRLTSRQLVENGAILPGWVPPSFPFAGVDHGFFFVPEPGDTVLLKMTLGSSDDAVRGESAIRNPDFRWLCGLYNKTGNVPEEFRRNYPGRMGFKSRGGMYLVFDDTQDHTYLTAPNIHLGSETSAEPLVLGDVFIAMMSTLLDLIAAHTHLWALGPTSPPTTSAAFLALKATPVVDRTIVSDVAYTEKQNP